MELLVRFFWKMTDIGVYFLSELKRRAVAWILAKLPGLETAYEQLRNVLHRRYFV